jgi:hypothetical protein
VATPVSISIHSITHISQGTYPVSHTKVCGNSSSPLLPSNSSKILAPLLVVELKLANNKSTNCIFVMKCYE